MSNPSLALRRPTLVDRVLSRGLATDIALVTAGAALTAGAAQLAVPLWPVPITGQTLAVLVVGGALGAVRGALSMVLYAVVGLAGLPVFSDGASGISVIAGPTGGYIVGFIFAAALTGWLAERKWDRKLLRGALAFAAGTVVTFAFGLPWLSFALQANLQQTLEWGLYPFILGGIVKALLAAGILRGAWGVVSWADSRKQG
ncbi:biotin transporter BioY [Lysobacter korlensis]|uniref:Biotin transporter n=1 Tax=Lysobacter korlensis TaxID=553636 RepID=A0ABV6S057_9GAMM